MLLIYHAYAGNIHHRSRRLEGTSLLPESRCIRCELSPDPESLGLRQTPLGFAMSMELRDTQTVVSLSMRGPILRCTRRAEDELCSFAQQSWRHPVRTWSSTPWRRGRFDHKMS